MKKITSRLSFNILLVLSIALNIWYLQQTREVSAEKTAALNSNIAGGRSFLIMGKAEIMTLLNESQTSTKEQKTAQLQTLNKDVFSAWQMFEQLRFLDSTHTNQWGKIADSLFKSYELLGRMQGEADRGGILSAENREKLQAVYDFLNVLHEGFDAEFTPSIRETGYHQSPSIDRAYRAAIEFDQKIGK